MDYEKMMEEVVEKRKSILENIDLAKSQQELDTLEIELRKNEITINNIKKQYPNDTDVLLVSARNATSQPNGDLQTVLSFRSTKTMNEEEDQYGTIEYRKAFMNYVMKGSPIPEAFVERRQDSITTVNDIGAVIPTTIQNKVIEDITVEGKILSRINQTSYQGGVEIPISEVNVTATWLESEAVVSDEQKAEMKARLKFGYHVLEARVAIGLLSSTVSLPIFEATVVKQLKKAMIKALETAILKGSGSGEPLGIIKYTLPEDQVITMTESNIGKVATWAGVEAKIPEAYEDSLIYMMAKSTWEMYLNGMTDTAGQKIGLGKINEKGQKILNGREVLTTDGFPGFASATSGDIFGVVVDLTQYCLNSNLAMYYKKYFNDDKNKWIHKALMIADGKMAIGEIGEESNKVLVGAKGLIYLKKQ